MDVTFHDHRQRTHYGYWYEQLARRCIHRLHPGPGHVLIDLDDPDSELEASFGKQLLYAGSPVGGLRIALYPERIESATTSDTQRFDVTTNCLIKALNDLTNGRTKQDPSPVSL